ncbi:hypothetical protein K438DRAFT_1822640 [Mycena galopus ATCC 62051]|nr:hypothetical protein K438DRAFT_1822640 [Mycena galopus ATCC 62051]
MSVQQPGSALPLGLNIGPLADGIFIGIMLSTFLWGITVVQTFNYFASNSANDGWMLKSFMGLLFALDTVTSALTLDMAHIYLIEKFGSLVTLASLPYSSILEVLFNDIIVFLVELFFARRVHLLNSRQKIMPALIVIFAVAGLCNFWNIYRC